MVAYPLLSLFLAKVIGLYFLIMGIYLFINYKRMPAIMSSLDTQPASLFIMAVINIILGLLLVVAHSFWTNTWTDVITVISYLTLLGGLLRLFAPKESLNFGSHLFKDNRAQIVGGLIALFGAWLTYMGFR